MRDQSVEETAQEVAQLLMPRAVPSTRFVHDLGQDIYRAAYQQTGHVPTVPFQDLVIELRKLIRLLRKTLVPIRPRETFVRSLELGLDVSANELIAARQRRMRWLMVGGMLGSALSLLGVVAALVLRRRQDRLQTKKSVGTL